MLIAVVGLLILLVKLGRKRCGQGERFRDYVFGLMCFYAFFWVGLAYQALTLFIAEGVSASAGWYMYCLVVPELILVYLGLQEACPSSLRRCILPGLAIAFSLLDLYGMHFLLIPYYSGLISHNTIYSGVFSHSTFSFVSPARIQQLVHTGLFMQIKRLLINKAPILTTGTLVILWLIYIAATAWLAISSWTLSSWQFADPDSSKQ